MSNDRHKYRIPFFDNSGKFIGFEDLDILKGVQPYNAGVCHRGEPEQCTGLTDRHNKSIYENDVVNMYIPYEDKHRKCVVRYVIDEGTAQWLAVYLEGKRPHCSMGICYDITSEYLDGSYCTVIGNIHDDQFREVAKMVEGEQCE